MYQLIETIAARVHLRSPRALSRAVMEMVADGDLAAGTRMPTIREIARRLRMSPSSVAVAWHELVDWRVLETRRRGGTRVLGPGLAPRAERYDVMMRAADGALLNLGNLTPDRSILPPLARALAAAAGSPELNDLAPAQVSAGLYRAIRPGWPFPASAFLATHGGIAALALALEGAIRPGDRVLVAVPTLPRVFDILDALGGRVVPIAVPDGEPDLAELGSALRQRPAALVYQPTGSVPTGHSVGPDWIAAAAALLRESRMPVIELVQTPLMQRRPHASIGQFLPASVVRIHSYNFFFGPDLRIGVAGGGTYYIEQMRQRLTFSSGWVSRILQNALAFQLTDGAAVADLERFVTICRERQQAMIRALRQAGLAAPDGEGPPIWLPVPDAAATVERLRRRRIVVHSGAHCYPAPAHSDHLVLNGTVLADGHAEVARAIAEAAAPGPGAAPRERARGGH